MSHSPIRLLSPTRESITALSTTTQKTPSPIDRYHAFASSGCQELICCICLETLRFPLSFPCQRHYACHKCIHQLVDTHKQFVNVDDLDQSVTCMPSILYPIKCPLCSNSTQNVEHTDCFLKSKLVPQTGLLLSLVQLVSGLQSHLPTDKRLRLPLVDDICCPYCNKAFHPNGSHGERYEHLANCPERKYTCTRCSVKVSASDLSRHLLETCPSFSCMECHQTGLTWGNFQDHTHRTNESSLRARSMQVSFVNASRFARLSHHEDWPQIPGVVNRSCETAIKHRKVPDRVDKIVLEYLKLQRSLEQLDRVWSEQDAVRLSSSDGMRSANL